MSTHPAAWEEASRGLSRDGVANLAETLFAMRSTSDLGMLCSIAGSHAVSALAASEYRLLRLDPRSGALRCLDEFGIETPYLAEPGGPVERALRLEAALFDVGLEPSAAREQGLWSRPPRALITMPLVSGGVLHGLLLISFERPHRFDADEESFADVIAGTLALALERAELQRAAAAERRRASELERRLHDDEETSSQVMSVVAHEIRSPLTAIKAYAEALLDSSASVQAQRDRFLGIINTECDRLSWLVADILDLARLDSGKRPLRLAGLALEPLVSEALDTLRPSARGRQLTFDLRVVPGMVVEADPDLLRRLLLNLMGNAIKYSPRAGSVTIVAEPRGDEWVGVVEDQGPGIAPEDLSRIFERFFRARSGDQTPAEGHGLGLAICQGIVGAHGGRIWAESQGTGARLCFAMPLRQLATPRARRIARMISDRTDVRQLCEETVELVAEMACAQIVSLALVDPEQGDLVITAARGLEDFDLCGRRTTLRSGVLGSVAAWGQPLLVKDIESDRRFERLSHKQYTTKSLLCVPLRVAGEVIGVYNVTNRHDGSAFTEEDLSVLTVLVERVGRALERVWAHAGNQRVMEEALDAIRSMTRLKRDGLLGGRDVVHLARALARAMGMSEPDIDLLGYVASIHDVGMTQLKGGVDGAEPLDEETRREVERHPEVSLEILRPFGYLARVSDLILTHHERFDGTGYPRGMRGESIPLGSRILAVVDAYDSMVKGRPYRMAKAKAEACDEIARHSGTQFDPRVVEAFLALPAIRDGEQ
jgi:signal transduction histidine kinase/putative methionine-R-sulfoxide reductase with GAF domain